MAIRAIVFAGSVCFTAFVVSTCSSSEDTTASNANGGTAGDSSIGKGGGGGSTTLQCHDPKSATLTPEAPPDTGLVFHVVGDVHAHPSDPRSKKNIILGMDDLKGLQPAASALVIDGDLTEQGYLDQWDYLKGALSGRIPEQTFYAIGNHEYHGTNSSTTERDRFQAFANVSSVYYEKTVGGYPFLILGGENGDGDAPKPAWTAMLSDAQVGWLDERLAALTSETRPTFVFMHQGPFDSNRKDELNAILSKYPNVLYFWAHWHRDLKNAKSEPNQYTNADGYQRIHTGSVQYCKDAAGNLHYDSAQGLRVEVHEDFVAIRGRDFPSHSWISASTYQYDMRKPSQVGSAALDGDLLQVFAAKSDGTGVTATGELESFGSDGTDAVLASAPIVAKNAAGGLEVFARDAQGALLHRAQSSPGGTWSDWENLGGSVLQNLSVGLNLKGPLEVFARGPDHALWHIWQTDSGWSDWTSLGGFLSTDPSVVRNPDGRLEVFARGLDGQAFHIWHETPSGSWTSWSALGGNFVSNVVAVAASDGTLQAFGLGTNHALYRSIQGEAGWSEWESLGGNFQSDPVVVLTSDDELHAFVRGADSALYTSSEGASGAWSDWSTLSGAIASTPIVAEHADGRLVVVARADDGSLATIHQQQPASCWSAWSTVDGDFAAF